MVALLLLSAAVAAEPRPDRYACRQINPIPGAHFALLFSVDAQPAGELVPTAVRLLDLETGKVRMQSAEPTRRPEYDLAEPQRDAWHFGEDEIAEYLLLLPHRELEAFERGVTVTEVFGGGRAQWVNEFICRLR